MLPLLIQNVRKLFWTWPSTQVGSLNRWGCAGCLRHSGSCHGSILLKNRKKTRYLPHRAELNYWHTLSSHYCLIVIITINHLMRHWNMLLKIITRMMWYFLPFPQGESTHHNESQSIYFLKLLTEGPDLEWKHTTVLRGTITQQELLPQPLTQSDHRKFSHYCLQCVQVACVHVCGQADVYTRGSFYLLDGRAKITLKLHNITDAKKALALELLSLKSYYF